MSEVRDIRELAQRAELEFHQNPSIKKPHPWRTGVWLSIACLALVGVALFQGNNEIYSAGPLSEAHAFIANDCRQCHSTWQPAKRLASLDADVFSTRHSSIDNQACLKCHAANEHHPNQIPAHHSLSCAACHREHQGKQVLAKVTDKQCLHCHQDLKSKGTTPTQFAQRITGFDAAHGHPEFLLWRRLASSSPDELKGDLVSGQEQRDQNLFDQNSHEKLTTFRDVLKKLRPGETGQNDSKSGLRDRTELKFNHATHFKAGGVPDRDGKSEDLAKNCKACHTADPAGRYLLPVNFESHCARCHPLWYDNQNHPNDEVPHERLELVRGYLTEKYTLEALQTKNPLGEHVPRIPLPGTANRSILNADQAASVEERVTQAEQFVLQNVQNKLQGGCKFCHTLEQKDPAGLPTIVPPDQPERWLLHSRFDHAAHRMLDCLKCHSAVKDSRPERESDHSQSAADVLLPKIADCQTCHVSPSGRTGTIKMDGFPAPDGHHPLAVSSRCTMCHIYHRRDRPEDPSVNYPGGQSQ